MINSLLGREIPIEHLLDYFGDYSRDLIDKVTQICSILDFDWKAEMPAICPGGLIWDTLESEK